MEQYRLYKGGWVNRVPHKAEKIDSSKASGLLKKGGSFVKNVYNWDKKEESSFWYVIKDEFGGIDELPAKVRNQVRKSYKTYDIRLVSPEEMQEKGFALFNESRARFGGDLSVTKEQWAQRVNGGKGDQDFWLAIDKETGKAEGFGINRIVDDYCSYVSMGVNPDAPKSTYPMYGLILEMNRYYLEELKLKYVCDGARSTTEHSNIQPFLEEKFKFRKAYCDLQLFYKPWLGLVVKILFPFRKIIKNKKIMAFLYQESMARGLA
ncbi:MAG: hypothetical protein IKQ09_01475 [Bacteroidales bacterium]|nr:hypothetical protein [Bacteroidales bacterium]